MTRPSLSAVSSRSPFALLIGALFAATLLGAGCTSGNAESSNAASSAASGELPNVIVYKSASCNCCARWADHMKEAGFPVEAKNVANLAAKKNELGVPQKLRSCHTATVGGEVVEGHVPARVVKGYLRGEEKARAQGLAVPGMPTGSPGMEMRGRPAQPYRVLAFKKDGRAGTYSRHNQDSEQ
jgi:hypothetical protein